MFTIDTNILIYYAAGDRAIVDFFEARQYEIFYIPSIVVVEFLSYPLITSETILKFQEFVRQTIIVNLDYSIAELAAELRRTKKLGLADAVIAASSIITGSSLVSRNIRDFKRVENIRIISP